MAVQLIEQARSIALCTPPPIDMWAPRRIFDWRFLIFDLAGEDRDRRLASFIQSKIEDLKSKIAWGATPVSSGFLHLYIRKVCKLAQVRHRGLSH